MKKILAIMLFAFASALVMPAFAQKPAVVTTEKAGWHKIGETTADMKSEKDEIIVMGNDRFKSLKVIVTDQPISITSIVIYYEGGNSENVTLNSDMKAGYETGVIDLKGDKEINKVSFVYKTVANSKNDKSHVELWGLK